MADLDGEAGEAAAAALRGRGLELGRRRGAAT